MKALLALLFLVPGFASAVPMTATDSVQVCVIPLPVFEATRLNRLLLGTNHIYIKVNGKTFGTPHTANHTYFGGDAYLYSEDLYARRSELVRDEKCFPIQRPEEVSDEDFTAKIDCIAEKMKVLEKGSTDQRSWYPIFDYHGLRNNCGSMADYLVRCGGGKIGKLFNYSVGDRVPLKKMAKIQSTTESSEVQISSYGEICEKALLECSAP